jgi:hypothetical protein
MTAMIDQRVGDVFPWRDRNHRTWRPAWYANGDRRRDNECIAVAVGEATSPLRTAAAMVSLGDVGAALSVEMVQNYILACHHMEGMVADAPFGRTSAPL